MAIGDAGKADLATARTDGSREAGLGVGMAAHDPKAEAGFLDAAAAQLDALAEQDFDENGRPTKPPRKRRAPKSIDDDGDDEDPYAGMTAKERRRAMKKDADDAASTEDEQKRAQFDEEDDADEDEDLDDDDQDEDEERAGELADDDDDEDEEDARISLRVNGKKADLEDVLPYAKVTVVVDGEELEVSGDELIKGYQRGADYSNKTTELKQMKEELLPYNQMVAYAKNDPQFTAYVQSYFQNGPFPELANNPDLRVTDAELAAMADRNNADYDPDRVQAVMKVRAEWQQKAGERHQVNQRAMQDMQARYAEWARSQILAAQAQIDALGEPPGKDGRGEYVRKSEQVLASLKEMGFNEQEISGQAMINATDARAAVLAYKASEYDRMMREADTPRVVLGKKRKRPAPPRSQAPGSGTRRPPRKRQQRDSFRQASKTQRSDDWVTAIQNRLT